MRGSLQWKLNISRGRKNNPTSGPKYWLGKKHDEAYKKKMSLALSGKNNPRHGVKLDEDIKKRISESVKAYWKRHGTDKIKGHRPQTSLALKGHKVSDKTRKLIGLKSATRIADKNGNWKGGKPKCPKCGKEMFYYSKKCKRCDIKERGKRFAKLNKSRSKKDRIRIAVIGRHALINRNGYTSIEKKTYNILTRNKVKFIKQATINNKYLVDLLIPNKKIIIECDGKYWHNLPGIKKKDRNKNIYFKNNGYTILRWKEKDINNNLDKLFLDLKNNYL